MARKESVFAKRLKQARERKDISQRRLGILAGIHQDSASSRINQYEHGKHEPDFGTVLILAKTLDVPTAFFYAVDDFLADLILAADKLSDAEKKRLLRQLAAADA